MACIVYETVAWNSLAWLVTAADEPAAFVVILDRLNRPNNRQ